MYNGGISLSLHIYIYIYTYVHTYIHIYDATILFNNDICIILYI